MMRSRCGFLVNAVFISHWHADHFLGLFGLVQTMSFNGRTEPLTIYGPEWVHEFVAGTKQVARFNLKFSLESQGAGPGSWVRFDGYTITAFAVKHGLPSLGYVLEEDSRPGRFNREQAIALGVQPGPLFGRLQRGESIRTGSGDDGREILPRKVMGSPLSRATDCSILVTPGRYTCKSGISPMMQIPDSMMPLMMNLKVVDRGAEFFHATAAQAGKTPAVLNARTLALVHTSSRYRSRNGSRHRSKRKNFQEM